MPNPPSTSLDRRRRRASLAGHPTGGVEAKAGRWLTAGLPMGEAVPHRRYRPLVEHSGLCRILADTEPSEAGVLAFADRYGLLGEGDEMIQLRVTPTGSVLGVGERLAVWVRQILLLRWVIELWEQAMAGDVERLRQHILWSTDGGWVGYDSHLGLAPGAPPPPEGRVWDMIWNAQIHGLAGEALQPGDVVRPALILVRQKINEALKERVSPQLCWNQPRTALSLQLVPSSLVAALWLQLASCYRARRAVSPLRRVRQMVRGLAERRKGRQAVLLARLPDPRLSPAAIRGAPAAGRRHVRGRDRGSTSRSTPPPWPAGWRARRDRSPAPSAASGRAEAAGGWSGRARWSR